MTTPVTGAIPHGASDEATAAQSVQRMFNSIAPRYDLLNHVLSANIDRLWWARAARQFWPILAHPSAEILDICCGTGDMTLALLQYRPYGSHPILAVDFAHQMLARGARKFTARYARNVADTCMHIGDCPRALLDQPDVNPPHAIAIEADALRLPLASGRLHLVTTAFGFRNLANYRAGLEEFARVLQPGGQLGILEFSEPDGWIGKLYALYFRRVLPAIGRLLGGSASDPEGQTGPYHYLPASVRRFPSPDEMLSLIRSCGFREATWTPYTFGIAGLYMATRE